MSQRLQQPVAWLTRVDEGGFINFRDFAVFPWFGHNVLFPDLPPWPTYSLPTFFLFFSTFIGVSIFAYKRLKNGWLMETHLLKSAVQLRTRLMGSADWPTPGEAKLMVDLVKQLELRNDPGIELPKLRTDLSPPSHFEHLPITELFMKAHRFYLDERYSDALLMWKEAAVRAERILGSAHRETIFAWANIGHVLFRHRNTEDAYLYLLKVGAVSERAQNVPPNLLGNALMELAIISQRLHEDEQAESAARRGLAHLERSKLDDPQQLGAALLIHASALAQLAQFDEALKVVLQAEHNLEQKATYLLPPTLLTRARILHSMLLIDTHHEAADEYVTAVREELQAYSPAVAWPLLRELATALWARGHLPAAMRIFSTALERYPEILEFISDRLSMLYELKRFDEARRWEIFLRAMMRRLKRHLLKARRRGYKPGVKPPRKHKEKATKEKKKSSGSKSKGFEGESDDEYSDIEEDDEDFGNFIDEEMGEEEQQEDNEGAEDELPIARERSAKDLEIRRLKAKAEAREREEAAVRREEELRMQDALRKERPIRPLSERAKEKIKMGVRDRIRAELAKKRLLRERLPWIEPHELDKEHEAPPNLFQLIEGWEPEGDAKAEEKRKKKEKQDEEVTEADIDEMFSGDENDLTDSEKKLRERLKAEIKQRREAKRRKEEEAAEAESKEMKARKVAKQALTEEETTLTDSWWDNNMGKQPDESRAEWEVRVKEVRKAMAKRKGLEPVPFESEGFSGAFDRERANIKAVLNDLLAPPLPAGFSPLYWSMARFQPPLATSRFAQVTEAKIIGQRILHLRIELYSVPAPSGQRALYLPLPCLVRLSFQHPGTGVQMLMQRELAANATRTHHVTFTTDELPFKEGALYAARIELEQTESGASTGTMLQFFYCASEAELNTPEWSVKPKPQRPTEDQKEQWPIRSKIAEERAKAMEAWEPSLGGLSDPEEEEKKQQEKRKAKRKVRIQAAKAMRDEDEEEDEEEEEEESESSEGEDFDDEGLEDTSAGRRINEADDEGDLDEEDEEDEDENDFDEGNDYE